MHARHGVCARMCRSEDRGVSFLLLPRGYRELNSGYQAQQQVPLLAKPSHQPTSLMFWRHFFRKGLTM